MNCQCGYPDMPGRCPGPHNCPMAQNGLNDVLDRINDYLLDHSDYKDGDDGAQEANEAMNLLADLRKARGHE